MAETLARSSFLRFIRAFFYTRASMTNNDTRLMIRNANPPPSTLFLNSLHNAHLHIAYLTGIFQHCARAANRRLYYRRERALSTLPRERERDTRSRGNGFSKMRTHAFMRIYIYGFLSLAPRNSAFGRAISIARAFMWLSDVRC